MLLHKLGYARGQAKVVKLYDFAKSFANYLLGRIKRIAERAVFDS